jgi:hypothetical protein
MRSRPVLMNRAACGPMLSGAIPSGVKFEIKATRPLMTMLNEVAALLDWRPAMPLSPYEDLKNRVTLGVKRR